MSAALYQQRPTGGGIIPLTVTGAARTDCGPVRPRNEDSIAYRAPEEVGLLLRKGVLALVADGMGGHEGGEVASGIAARRVAEAYFASPLAPQEALLAAFAAANDDIFARARAERTLLGMGTTCTAVAVVNGLAYCAHVGDSRAYLIRAGQAYCLTEDHSTTMELVKQGKLTRAEARVHEERNVILRAMGTRPKLEPAVWAAPLPLRPGDRIALCTDGLYDVVEEEELAGLAEGLPAGPACDRLIALATVRRTKDNASVALLQLSGTAP